MSAGPSTPVRVNNRVADASRDDGTQGSLWESILASADRQKGFGRKNIILLSERNHGRTHLLSQLTTRKKSSKSQSHSTSQAKSQDRAQRSGLALGYDVIEAGEDEDAAPPVSVFYPPSSHPSLLKLVPSALPPRSLSDTAVVIVLDWTRPSSMLQELLTWLVWVQQWASGSAERGEVEEMHEDLQSYLQHYTEPSPNANASSASTYAGVGPLLPLGPGTLSLNSAGIPIVVVITKADLIDNPAEEMGLKGGATWEERTDWVQQALRVVCLSYGAALFYTAPTQPQTYTLLKEYLLHRLYTVPPPLHPVSSPSATTTTHPTSAAAAPGSGPGLGAPGAQKFPFNHRANVLDRDAVMVPAGWDSWGKIKVLGDGFEVERVSRGWETSFARRSSAGTGQDQVGESEPLETLWSSLLPSPVSPPHQSAQSPATQQTESEQVFLSRHLEALMKDPARDPRMSFRHAAATVVGPMGGSEGLSLPGVEKAMKEMEGDVAAGAGSTGGGAGTGGAAGAGGEVGEGLKEKFKMGKKDGRPSTPAGAGSAMPNEALHNFFQGLLANRGKTGTPPAKTAPSDK